MKITLIILCGFLTSCATTNVPVPSHREPKKNAKVFYPKNSWNINSPESLNEVQKALNAKVSQKDEILILDLNGGILDGSKQKGDRSQNENQEPLFRANVPFFIKNGFVINNKNAATFQSKNSGIEKVTFLNVGEDAVATSRNAYNFSVKNCEFLNSSKGDKSVQLNQASYARIYNNLIYGGITGFRVHESSWADQHNVAYCANNRFVGVDTAWNVATGVLLVEGKNKYSNVKLPFKISKGGRITNADGKVEEE